MTYEVKFTKSARKSFKKLSPEVQERIQIKIDELVIEPRPNGVKKLKGEENLYRIRVGDYRVIYEIFDDVLLVSVVEVGHRSNIYKDES
ncbi:type II toxin-antitoxin system RelE/ParE family toxin [Nostoc sp. FACHB-87]|uniref:type II toxin-antitoxin system RelE family toxin n=1 Tax=Nostocales TaxID=1161 RepID=UPI0016827D75|nr:MULTISPECIES: type II toxin-antitoxin system RelE/ParE family toxin [Nostocales]MBD2298088.1 type II toxin-antitoxin system RelE/ParE family toxin [Nostoc sp. FACHB-190]MBD2454019.1 type II toxin-antitoxin system RelE/ParE family toxin [Nostoc sp. FACHB-87]MBD2476286.1 type II toxin-antitoxin system RelE/ParE family toxin [Anabaena sp. FACHB-83]MBD2489498.1 type II toxin-antitoxin system RelE/ParE family toxin [Aulosira sp. FACHB-615]